MEIGEYIDDLEARIQRLRSRLDLGDELAAALGDVADTPAFLRDALLEALTAVGQLEATVSAIEEAFANEQ